MAFGNAVGSRSDMKVSSVLLRSFKCNSVENSDDPDCSNVEADDSYLVISLKHLRMAKVSLYCHNW